MCPLGKKPSNDARFFRCLSFVLTEAKSKKKSEGDPRVDLLLHVTCDRHRSFSTFSEGGVLLFVGILLWVFYEIASGNVLPLSGVQ